MSNDMKSIHEPDFNLLCEYFSLLDRQGPGSPTVTLKAASFIEISASEPLIADIGCGTGSQTMVLADHFAGQISAIDLSPIFIELLNANVRQKHLQHRVKGLVGSMNNLPFMDEELDLIWSEGAIYNIGFQRGLAEWRRFLKPGGYIAVSEASWFTDERPAEINTFWEKEYPEIDTVSNKVGHMQKCGYIPIATFILPDNCWTENFYDPQIAAQEIFLKRHHGNSNAEELVADQSLEAELYRKFKEYYGYVFYIGKKCSPMKH